MAGISVQDLVSVWLLCTVKTMLTLVPHVVQACISNSHQPDSLTFMWQPCSVINFL